MSSPWVYPFGGTTPALHYPAEPPPRLDPGYMGATSRGTGPMNIIPISPMLIFVVPSSNLTQFGQREFCMYPPLKAASNLHCLLSNEIYVLIVSLTLFYSHIYKSSQINYSVAIRITRGMRITGCEEDVPESVSFNNYNLRSLQLVTVLCSSKLDWPNLILLESLDIKI